MRLVTTLALCTVALFLGSCGGGGGGGGGAITVTLVSGSPEGGYTSDPFFIPSASIGDVSTNTASRSFWSFDVSGIPAGATVSQATLRVSQLGSFGDPYTLLGNVIVERIDIGASLTFADFASPALGGFVVLSSDSTIEIKTADLTTQVQAALAAAAPRVDVRGRGQGALTDSDGVRDSAEFATSAEVSPTQVCELVITYTAP